MQNKNPYLKNPVANQIFEGYYSSLFENEKVDALLRKISDNALDVFKRLTFDLAPKRDRNPDTIRKKLSQLADASSVKALTASLKDMSADNDLVNSKFSEAKRLYLEALGKFCEALNRSHEINKSKDEVILKNFKLVPSKIQTVIDNIAKEEEERQKREKMNENIHEEGYLLYEGLFSGYRGRIENLKKSLTNLITSAEGKDQKSGYGRDWKRTFLDLDEKRKSLDITSGGHGTKDKEKLEDLEKQVEKFQTEFNNALVQSANRSLQNLEDDEEIGSSFTDVTSLLGTGLDFLTRAHVQDRMALQEIRSEHEEEENLVSKSVFPLRRGDTDSDKKIKNSGLINAIQTALCNGIPAAKKLITSKGGPNGKFGPATQSVIATIQKISGNKNTNGELDKTLLDDILSSDWVDAKDKDAIEKSLSVIRKKLNENSTTVLGWDNFVKPINEEKILLNKAEFEKELATQYKNIVGEIKSKGGEIAESPEAGGSSSGVKTLSKSLRQKYSLKIEADDFLKSDGSLKSSYSPQFIKAWSDSIEKIGDDIEEYSYFWFSGGVYNINVSSSSLKNACNWKKWTDSRGIGNLDDEDAVDFLTNYLKGWVTFGLIRPGFRYDGIKELIKQNSDNEDFDLSNVYEMMDGSITNREIPYIPYDILKGEIAKAFRIVCQKEEKNPDLDKSDFVAINNFLVMMANAVSYNGSKMISCIKWIHDNIMGESTAKRIAKDSILGGFKDLDNSVDDEDTGKMLGFKSSSVVVQSAKDIASKKLELKTKSSEDLSGFSPLIDLNSNSSPIKKALGKNSYYIVNEIYPSIRDHVKRMNADDFEDVPQNKPFKCLDSKM